MSVAERTVRRWVADGMPGGEGYYDLEEIERWRDMTVCSSGDGDSVDGSLKERKLRAEVRKLNAEAEAKEVKNQQLAGELVHRDDVLREVSELVLRVKTRLESVPNEMEMEFPAEQRAQLKALVANRVELILREMAGWQLEGEGDERQVPDEQDGDREDR